MRHYKKFILFLSVAVACICVMEGIYYFRDIQSNFLKFTLNLQNVFNTFKLNPDIKIIDAARHMAESGTSIPDFLPYLYTLAVILAPVCTLSTGLFLLNIPFRYLQGLIRTFRKKKIILVGNGRHRSGFLERLSVDNKVYVFGDSAPVGVAADAGYLTRGVKFFGTEDFASKVFWKGKRLNDFEIILFCDEDYHVNRQLYQRLAKAVDDGVVSFGTSGSCPEIYIVNQNQHISLDELTALCECGDLDAGNGVPVTVYDINRKMVNLILNRVHIWSANANGADANGADANSTDTNSVDTNGADVHLGIMGFGGFGQNFLMQALNRSVLSADSYIVADVFDVDMDNLIGNFLNLFSEKVLRHLSYERTNLVPGMQTGYYLLDFDRVNSDDVSVDPDSNSNHAWAGKISYLFPPDIRLKIRFWNLDVNSVFFKKAFAEMGSANPFTYLVLCPGKVADISSALQNLHSLTGSAGCAARDVPMVVKHHDDIYEYRAGSLQPLIIPSEGRSDGDMPTRYKSSGNYPGDRCDSGIYSKAILQNRGILEMAKKFHNDYNAKHEENHPGERGTGWDELSAYAKESSIHSALAQSTREWICRERTDENGLNMLIRRKEELMQIEHRRWNIYMMTRGYRFGNDTNRDRKIHNSLMTWDDLKTYKPGELAYDFTPYELLVK
ncbi:MAG: hypothetical protein Q4A41_00550 [Bacillota bacterium]|nr:hypothetical protein [Bacillota bacterium]